MAARKKKVVTEADINVEQGKGKDERLLEAYLEQASPEDTKRLLERCVRTGSERMVQAAFPRLALLDVPTASTLALEFAARGEQLKKKKDRDALFEWLRIVATPACLERAEALGLPLEPLHSSQLENAFDWLPGALERARARGDTGWLGRHVAGLHAPEGRACEWFVAQLDAPGTTAEERDELFRALTALGHEPTIHRADLPDAYRPIGAFTLGSGACFDRLAPLLTTLPLTEALAAFKTGHQLKHPADERWVDFWLARCGGDTALEANALFALAQAALLHEDAPASRHTLKLLVERIRDAAWDDELWRWLQARGLSGNPALTDYAFKGVTGAAEHYEDWGHRRLHARLSGFVPLARTEHVAALERLAAEVDRATKGSQTPAEWFAEAIAAIRARLS